MAGLEKTDLPPVSQIGIVVRDLQKTADYYTSTFGIGPFTMLDVNLDGVILRGKPGNMKIKVGFAQSGAMQIEMIQPLEGDNNLYAEFLDAKGEGIHHLGIQVDDFEAALAGMAGAGFQPVLYRNQDGFAFAYMDTDKVGGIMIELIWSGQNRVSSKAI